MIIQKPPTDEAQLPRWREWVNQVFHGREQHGIVWDDVYPVAVSVGGAASTPSFTAYSGNFQAYEFVGAATAKALRMEFQFPHGRTDGSPIIPHLHLYIPDDGTGGIIRFTCEYEWSDVNDTGAISGNTLTGTITRTASQGIAQNAVLSFGEVADAGHGVSSIFSCVITRDPTNAGDTFGASVWLRSADIHVQKTWLGSTGQFAR